jgi:phosphoglucosamine mutase
LSSSRQLAGQQIGRAKRLDGEQARYIEFAKRTLPRSMSLSGCASCSIAPMVRPTRWRRRCLWELGAEVITIGDKPDGVNINARSAVRPSLKRCAIRFVKLRADVGIALDGDADRVVLVDENGSIDQGDQLMAVVADSWRADDRLTQPGVVATVMSNLGLERYLEGNRASTLVRTQVGDRYVVEHMRANGYNVGGEQSGHIILSDFVTTGDGLVSALQVMSCVKDQGRPVSEVCRRFDPVPQVLKNVRYKGGKPLDSTDVKSAIQDGEDRLGQSGRLVIRPSGTEPADPGDGRRRRPDQMIETVVDQLINVISATRNAA